MAVLALILIAVGALLAPEFDAPGLEMDEGALLAYPERILEGAIPHRDYTTPYGPGAFWTLAAVFEVFGATPDVERAVGLCYRLLIVGALFVIALPAGVAVASMSALLCGAVLLNTGLLAASGIGAIALGLLGIATALAAAGGSSWGASRRLPLLAGLSLGAAILFRFDFAPAVLLGALPAVVALGRSERKWLLGGVAAMACLYIPDLIASWSNLDRLTADLRHSPGGRRLPVPSLSSDLGQLLGAQWLVAGLALVVGGHSVRAPSGKPVGLALLSLGLFVVALQPWVLSRADLGHVASAAAIGGGALPLVACVLAALLYPGAADRALVLMGLALTLGVLLLLAPGLLRGSVKAHVERLAGTGDSPSATVVHNGDRSFPLGPDAHPADVRALLHDIERSSSPGDRLFVGSFDLRRTSYVDTFLYYLLPELEPASFYMEFTPGGANRPGSGLADEIRRADVVVLNHRWDAWDEPNDSRELGPAEPNRVTRQLFCLRSRHGPYELRRRCR